MRGTNLCVFVGHVGGQPEKRSTRSGKSVLNFSIAVNDEWKDAQGVLQERTEWVRVAIFGPAGEGLARFLAKGHLVIVTGRMRTKEYVKNDEKRFSTSIVADRVQILTPKGDGAKRPPATSGPSGPQRALDALAPPAASSEPEMPSDDFFANGDEEIPF